jgi:hypothetical protein
MSSGPKLYQTTGGTQTVSGVSHLAMATLGLGFSALLIGTIGLPTELIEVQTSIPSRVEMLRGSAYYPGGSNGRVIKDHAWVKITDAVTGVGWTSGAEAKVASNAALGPPTRGEVELEGASASTRSGGVGSALAMSAAALELSVSTSNVVNLAGPYGSQAEVGDAEVFHLSMDEIIAIMEAT